MRSVSSLERKKSKKWGVINNNNNAAAHNGYDPMGGGIDPAMLLGYSSSLITEAPGSIAAVRREQMALQHAQRKMKIAHYGRSKSAKFESRVSPLVESLGNIKTSETPVHERRCTSVTPNSGNHYYLFSYFCFWKIIKIYGLFFVGFPFVFFVLKMTIQNWRQLIFGFLIL